MYEIICPQCSASFEYNPEDYIHLCADCSTGFVLDIEENAKDIVGDHFIIPNKIERQEVENLFYEWINTRYHRADKVKKEFNILGFYGILLPHWVISMEAHTFWSGHSAKANEYSGQSKDHYSKFVKEEGRFRRKYRWAILARKSPKEHWGLERLHHPREQVMVDWDGYPLDESMGTLAKGEKPFYDSKNIFKFDLANSLTVSGVQVKESSAIARAKDQVTEYHRRIAKTKVGTLYEHRTEIEVVGIHLLHNPFWVLRYSYTPNSPFRFFTTARERRILIQGFSKVVLEAELPLNASDKVMTNLIVCAVLGLVSLFLSVFFHPSFFLLFLLFTTICILSSYKLFSRNKVDTDLIKGAENKEPA